MISLENKKILISFIAGSSFFVTGPLFSLVTQLFHRKEAIFDYFKYSIHAPLFIGLASAFAKILHLRGMSLKSAYFLVSILSPMYVAVIITVNKSYNFTSRTRWLLQYALLFTVHLILYNIIIINLDNFLTFTNRKSKEMGVFLHKCNKS